MARLRDNRHKVASIVLKTFLLSLSLSLVLTQSLATAQFLSSQSHRSKFERSFFSKL